MKEVKMYEDEHNSISMFRDSFKGVVLQLFRKIESKVPGEEGLVSKKNNVLIEQQVVSVSKNPEKFKVDIEIAQSHLMAKLKDIQMSDNIIDGVLNDYESKYRKLNR